MQSPVAMASLMLLLMVMVVVSRVSPMQNTLRTYVMAVVWTVTCVPWKMNRRLLNRLYIRNYLVWILGNSSRVCSVVYPTRPALVTPAVQTVEMPTP